MTDKRGSLSIDSENIFPIIKKWLYSDHDIFLRELVSNGSDAITKLKKLALIGEASLPEDYKPKIEVRVSSNNKTIKVIDNGIGMTAEEVDQYINQIAFSGAADFMTKYKDKASDDQIIGHFGLGFYSVFMVSDNVTIDTLSWQPGAQAVHWESESGIDFEMTDSDWSEPGTCITLHMAPDSYEFSNEYRIREVLEKYCSFMPVEIFLINEDAPKPEVKEGEEEKAPEPVNDTAPLWSKHPNECTDEDYKAFYRKVFRDYKEPLFWIHLNMDYPFDLKGILYFPKINLGYDSLEGVIKLYNNQVFVADNIKEVIPEYMMLLKGVIDCPDLPLNVSRSALQNDGFVKKIQDYISKKIADKLSGLCKVDREFYEKNWDSISPFVKYGCLKDEKFCQRMTDYILFKDLDGAYKVLPECLEVKPIDPGDDEDEEIREGGDGTKAEGAAEGTENPEDGVDTAAETEESPAENAAPAEGETSGEGTAEEAPADEKKEKTVYYVTDTVQQSQYINMFKKAKMEAVILPDEIDMPFIQQLEMKNEGIHFKRIDADVEDTFRVKQTRKLEEELQADTEVLSALFKKVLKKDNVKIKVDKLRNKEISSLLLLSEESRRMQEMMKQYGMMGMDLGDLAKGDQTLVLNTNHKLVKYLLAHGEDENVPVICEELYDLARIQQAPLDPEAMTKFVARTNKILGMLSSEE
ncbi:MAG: molecular chaperone HtpG [Lachnospiraceae bacterium]|nr:molecular chaperone HtpG [Lachnospiraceae bacterium]